jgi:hypothetical protein
MFVPAHAQKKGYARGYIINSEGETVDGWVKDRSSGTFIDLYTQIRFKPDNARSKKKYSPAEIQGYGLNKQHFKSMPLIEESAFFQFRYYLNESNDRVFLKVIARNENLTYYHWEYVDGESNYLDYTPLFHRIGSNEMVRVTQGIFGLKRDRLMEYFRDCPELTQALENKQLKEINEVFNFYVEQCLKDTN